MSLTYFTSGGKPEAQRPHTQSRNDCSMCRVGGRRANDANFVTEPALALTLSVPLRLLTTLTFTQSARYFRLPLIVGDFEEPNAAILPVYQRQKKPPHLPSRASVRRFYYRQLSLPLICSVSLPCSRLERALFNINHIDCQD